MEVANDVFKVSTASYLNETIMSCDLRPTITSDPADMVIIVWDSFSGQQKCIHMVGKCSSDKRCLLAGIFM